MKAPDRFAVEIDRAYAKFRLQYNSKADPIGDERGAVLVADLARGMPEFNVRQYYSTQPTIFYDYDHVVTGYSTTTGEAIGLLGARWLGPPELRFLYLWTAMLADAYRHSQLFKRMVSYFFEQIALERGWDSLPTLVVTKTYNPVVYNFFKSFTLVMPSAEIYPQIPCAGEQPEAMVELACRIAHAISPALQLEPQIGMAVGGQAMVAPDFFPRMEACSDPDVNEHFRRHLTRSDQILCIVRLPEHIKHAAFARLIGRK